MAPEVVLGQPYNEKVDVFRYNGLFLHILIYIPFLHILYTRMFMYISYVSPIPVLNPVKKK